MGTLYIFWVKRRYENERFQRKTGYISKTVRDAVKVH